MINQKDMWHIYTTADGGTNSAQDWTWRMQSITRQYLEARGREWVRLGLIHDFKVKQNKNVEEGI